MKKSMMTKFNWIFVILGVCVTYLGFFLISFITTNYDGFYAFISVLTTVIGLVLVVIGLSVNFEETKE
jgi:prepilin signal peptidase PulO-like enzyme (type II secretory pathway)